MPIARITKAYIRRYSDNGQITAYVEQKYYTVRIEVQHGEQWALMHFDGRRR